MSDKENSKKLSTIAVAISILSLIASLIFSSYSLSLANEANRLTEKSLDLQIMQSNYTSTIIPKVDIVVLDSGGTYTVWDDVFSDNPAVSRGWLNGSIYVITPHIGTLSIEKKSFLPDNLHSDLQPDKVNQTTVDFSSESRDRDEMFVTSGLTMLNFSYRLEATFYPDPDKISTTLPEWSRAFPLGYLYLEAKFVTQTGMTLTQDFDVDVLVVVRNY